MSEPTVQQLTAEVDALTKKVTDMSNLLALFMVNGLADAFDGTGNQAFGGGVQRLDDTGYQIAMGTGNNFVGIRFFEKFKGKDLVVAANEYPNASLLSKWSGTSLNTTLHSAASASFEGNLTFVSTASGSLAKLSSGAAGYVSPNSNATGDYIELLGRLLPGSLTPAQITADQDNYAPAGYASNSVLRLSSDAARTITGITATFGGLLILVNVGAQNIVLADESGSSTAANRFALSAAVTLAPDEGATLLYDATSQRWRLVGR